MSKSSQVDLFTSGTAVFSPCRAYRYELRRVWDPSLPTVGWIMLNPSTATETVNDPTVRRCIGFTRDWGYGGLTVRNIFALRSTDPKALKGHPDPVGPDNDEHLARGAASEDAWTICAWGAHGSLNGRDREVMDLLSESGAVVHHLGLTKLGAPRHPLYLPRTAEPTVLNTSRKDLAA